LVAVVRLILTAVIQFSAQLLQQVAVQAALILLMVQMAAQVVAVVLLAPQLVMAALATHHQFLLLKVIMGAMAQQLEALPTQAAVVAHLLLELMEALLRQVVVMVVTELPLRFLAHH
jgi:hypothetical protein